MSSDPIATSDNQAAEFPSDANDSDEKAHVGVCLIVGYDGSAEARHAAAWAARRAAPDGKLVLVNASGARRPWLPWALLSSAAERRTQGRALLDELLMDGDDALYEVRLRARVVDDTPVSALIAAARKHEADEIVVGSHHRSRLDRVYGDVAAELVRRAPVPVCVVPLDADPFRDATGAHDVKR